MLKVISLFIQVALCGALSCPTSFAAPRSTRPQAPLRKPSSTQPQKPALKRGEYLQLKAQGTNKPLAIVPKSLEAPPSKDPAYFQLSQANGNLILSFQTKDRNLRLSSQDPIVIQLIPSTPLQVEPSIILNSDWPKNANQMTLKAIGGNPKSENRIFGKAAFTYCEGSTKVCKKKISTINYYYKL